LVFLPSPLEGLADLLVVRGGVDEVRVDLERDDRVGVAPRLPSRRQKARVSAWHLRLERERRGSIPGFTHHDIEIRYAEPD
jgi:hypothetical protein